MLPIFYRFIISGLIYHSCSLHVNQVADGLRSVLGFQTDSDMLFKRTYFPVPYLCSMVERIITENQVKLLMFADQLVDDYKLGPGNRFKERLKHLVRAMKIKNNVTNGKWQVAQMMCRTRELQEYLYRELIEAQSYSAAQTVYRQYNIQRFSTVPPVTQENVSRCFNYHIHMEIMYLNILILYLMVYS